jgi:hypothetical protein
MKHTNHNNTPSITITPAAARLNDARLDAALAHKPQPVVPAAFAAQVVSQLAARAAALPPRRRRSAPQFGPALTWASILLLPVALFALAPHAAPSFSNFRFDAELLLLAELAAIGYGFARGFGQRLPR